MPPRATHDTGLVRPRYQWATATMCRNRPPGWPPVETSQYAKRLKYIFGFQGRLGSQPSTACQSSPSGLASMPGGTGLGRWPVTAYIRPASWQPTPWACAAGNRRKPNAAIPHARPRGVDAGASERLLDGWGKPATHYRTFQRGQTNHQTRIGRVL